MIYTYAYPRPAVTVDIIVLNKINNKEHLLLIERKDPPFKNCWALPGGFVDIDEDIEDAAYRELREETSINNINLTQFHAFGKPGRDPRGRTISIIYYGILQDSNQKIEAGDDAKTLKWFPINSLPNMAFDHTEIIEHFMAYSKKGS